MARILKIVALWLAAALMLGGCAAATEAGAVELFAVNVDKGDALLVRAGDYACLIDAGKPWAMGRVRAAMDMMGIEALDAVFLTHADDDHSGGLGWLAESDIPVGAWYASGAFFEVKEEKHPIVKAAAKRGQDPVWLNRGDRVPLGNSGAAFSVLAPFDTFTDKDNNNSLVMMLESDAGRMLFTGDMELPQEAALLSLGDDLSCAVLKVPNHADDDTVSEAFARACVAQLAIISTSTMEKPETPDEIVVARLEAVGTKCLVTQDADIGLWVKLSGGQAACEYVDVPGDAPTIYSVRIAEVSAADDTLTLSNSGADADLTGCSLHSSRGNELYAFPEGTILPAGGTLVIGSRNADGDFDLLWDEKKVVHKSKEDVFTLYDRYGRMVDRRMNDV